MVLRADGTVVVVNRGGRSLTLRQVPVFQQWPPGQQFWCSAAQVPSSSCRRRHFESNCR
jgi:hypothetical protein